MPALLDDPQTILKRVRERTAGGRWGIGTAGSYLRGIGAKAMGADPAEWEQVIKEAEQKLVYCDSEMQIQEISGGVLSEGDRDLMSRDVDMPHRKKLDVKTVPGAVLVFDADVTTNSEDRDGDILDPKGAKVDLAGPLLFDHFETIGKLVKLVQQNGKRVRTREAIMDFPLGRDVASFIEFGALRRMSHGFLPEEWKDRDGDDEDEFVGWHILAYEMMERSVVRVASNRDAFLIAWDRLGEGKFSTPWAKSFLRNAWDARPAQVQGITLSKDSPPTLGTIGVEIIGIKSGRALSKATETKVREARDDIAEIPGIDEVPRAASSLAKGAIEKLNEVLATNQEDADDNDDGKASGPLEAKQPTDTDALAAILAAPYGLRKHAVKVIGATLAAEDKAAAIAALKTLLRF